jgi:hypothetical protein
MLYVVTNISANSNNDNNIGNVLGRIPVNISWGGVIQYDNVATDFASPIFSENFKDIRIQLLDEEPNPMFFTPAAGLRLEEGISIINDWLSYDQNSEISTVNQPKLYISWSCKNLIWCMREWTGTDGDKGASKDPIDALRYLAVMQPEYGDSDTYKAIGGGSY